MIRTDDPYRSTGEGERDDDRDAAIQTTNKRFICDGGGA